MVNAIRRLAKAKGTSISELERECLLGKRTIYRWDDTNPAVDKVKSVADCLGVTVDELLKEAEDDDF